jgi:8-oxo-dGTP pyrophosphatase MutT (NUDIX family)
LGTFLENSKRRVFWLVARSCFALYRAFPIFGSLRASIAVITRNGKFLVIQRNDGRGVSLPGGIASWRESLDSALHREVREETGLTVDGFDLKKQYHSDADIPCDISVFVVQASGTLKSSWEGTPSWMTIEELQLHLLESQRAALDVMKQTSESRCDKA